ncbi:pentatricopeptide repeat-containing protein At1g02150-like [Rhododendron vialii]|uniref:pentatricopeptide repeat-containing protein At1g02150-like n=1 Tax=Rhododendron vialii TaxID=182163 RepID=UPI00265E19D3|nr:pentatricopeptide repeat-containing protein At1g02150-like [Rhododendron vialii]
MLLANQSTIPKSLLHHHHHRVSLSSPLSHSPSFPSGFRSKKHPVVRCSISKLANMFGDFVVSLLPQPSKEEVIEVIEGWKKYGNYKRALQICELMNTKPDLSGMTMTAADAALQLDLIDTVHGTLAAEDYFLKLPETLKDQQTYTVLLMAYVNSEMREKAESNTHTNDN